MKYKLFCLALCLCVFTACEKDEPVIPDEPVVPPTEQPEEPETPVGPEEPDVQPSEPVKGEEIGIYNIKIDDDIMAIVGSTTWRSICCGNGKCVAVGDDNNIAYSHDNGNSWNVTKTTATGIKWNAIMYDETNNNFVGCGEQNRILHTVSGDITNYSVQNPLIGGNWTDVIYENSGNNYVGIIISESNSTKVRCDTTTYGIESRSSKGLTGIKITKGHDDNVYGIVSTKSALEIKSGSTINAKTLKYLDFDDYIFNDIAYGNNVYVAVGNSGIIISVNKDDYNIIHEKQVGTNNWNAIIFEKGTFIIVGDSGYLATSTDGVSWETTKVGSGNLYAVCPVQ